jgi:peptidoglycan/LPS O-acetylase OafA/YrhL
MFRLFLASVVVLSHFTKLSVGTAAVELFFVLSGFWIYRMFDGKYRHAARPGTLFVASRIMRILPVFLIFNTLTLALHFAWRDHVAASQSAIDIIPNVIVIGYASLPFRPMVPAWSLDIEMQFYLLFPFIFSVMRNAHRNVWAVSLTILAASGAYMSVTLLQDETQNLLPFIGFFVLGMFCAHTRWHPSRRLAGGAALLCAGGLAVVLALPSLRGLALVTINQTEFAWNNPMNFAVAVLLAPLALCSVYGKSSRRDRLLGDMSYVVYCSHWLAVLLADHCLSELNRFAKAPALVVLIIATYLASLIVLVYVDRPIGRWRERWIDNYLRSSDNVRAVRALP